MSQRPITWTLAVLITLVSGAALHAGDDSGAVRKPKPPKEPRKVVVVSEDAVTTVLPDDSIYATEISIDMSGIRIVTVDGRTINVLTENLLGPDPLVDVHFPDGHSDPLPGFDPNDYPGGQQEQVVQLASNIHIPEDEIVRGDVICVFCDIEVDGRVTGSAISAFGNVQISGTVDGEAGAPFGRVRIGPDAVVRQNVFASRVLREAGGRIGGTRQELPLNLFGDEDGLGGLWSRQAFTIMVSLKILFWLFLVLLAHALAAKNITKVKARIQVSYVKSFLMGIVGQILLIPVFLLLLVTIIGIPVAIFALPLLVFAGLILAQAAVGQIVGDKISENTSLPLRTPLSRTVAGVAALQLFAYLAMVFIWPAGSPTDGGAFRLVTVGLIILSAITGYVVITLGAGAVLLTRWGTRPKDVPALALADVPPQSGQDSELLPLTTPLPLARPESGKSGAAPATG